MTPKLETLQLRLPSDLLAWIDQYRASQPAVPSRAETIRWLLSVGVAVETGGQNPPPRRVRLNDENGR
jgi:hypothetical protein